jgi:hypothetical protein
MQAGMSRVTAQVQLSRKLREGFFCKNKQLQFPGLRKNASVPAAAYM